MNNLTRSQFDILIKPIKSHRVKVREGLSYLEAWDVRAHLIRVFGFGGWSADVTDMQLLYEVETKTKQGKDAYKVAYRATLRLTIPQVGCTYTESAVGESTMPDFKRGDCHDMAIKTAASQAFKRAAMNLGTQFGLSLYDGGNQNDVVGAVAEGLIPGEDGTHPEAEIVSETPSDYLLDALMTDDDAAAWEQRVNATEDEAVLREMWESAAEGGLLDAPMPTGQTLRFMISERVADLRERS